MLFEQETRDILAEVMKALQTDLREEITRQGHVLTGRMRDSVDYTVEVEGSQLIGRMFIEDYGAILEVGVTASRIPYGGRTGVGGKSLYIEGLINFWRLRGLSGREAISAAFATATVQKREGMPTRASYQHSQTGERTGFTRTVIERNLDTIAQTIEDRFGAVLELRFAKEIAEGLEYIKFAA